uniref:helix-turn-helix domain-containing protein n=1 Tax=Gorillibacterium sp. sgz5001074 TaxID=3446695 RepID=UPI003F680EBB
LGSLVGLSETSIRNLEKGRNVTSVEIMLKLADLFGKGPLQLFPDSELAELAEMKWSRRLKQEA